MENNNQKVNRNDEDNISELSQQLKSAYRKYKNNNYYDNYGAIQRLKLGEFELNAFIKGQHDACIFSGCKYEFCKQCTLYNSQNNLTKNEQKNNDYSDIYFKKLAEKLYYTKNRNYLFKQIIKKIKIHSFPKKLINSKKDNNDLNIISNIREENYKVTKAHYFISLPVEAHILGVLWILRCGWVLDDRLYKNCYGNRINRFVLDSIKMEEEKGKRYSEFTPFLFEGYFKKYESWRDHALDEAKKLLESEKNSIIISLDLKDYYYGATIDFKDLKKDIKYSKEKIFSDEANNNNNNNKDDLENLDDDLTNFVEDIFNNYTNKFFKRKNYKDIIKNEEKELPLIPLGFLPSLIISNWYLQGFDQSILENIHPQYYGRYVDDLLIVLPSHEKSISHGEQHLVNMNISYVLEKYLSPHTSEPHNSIFKKLEKIRINDSKCSKYNILMQNLNKIHKEEDFHKIKNNIESIIKDIDNCIPYGIYNQTHIRECDKDNEEEFHYENLSIQPKKMKLFIFSHKNSKAMIDNFKKEIYDNSSEFRLMYEVDELCDNLGEKLYSLNYNESKNKLKDINGVKIDKFELSKILHKLLRTLIYENKDIIKSKNEKLEINEVYEVIEAFNGNILEFMILWEKLITFLYIKEGNSKFIKGTSKLEIQIKKIIKTIEKLECDLEDNYTFEYNDKIENPKNPENLELIKNSMLDFLYCTCARVFSLKSKPSIDIDKIFNSSKINLSYHNNGNYSKDAFLSSSLQNNLLMRSPLIDCSEILDGDYDLTKHQICEIDDFNGFAYPRYVQFHECVLHYLNKHIYESLKNNKNTLNSNAYLSEAFKYYYKLNGISENTNSEFNNTFFRLNCYNKCYKEKKEDEDEKNRYCSNKEINNIIKAGTDNKDTVKIGIVNTKLNEKIFEEKLKGNDNHTSSRLDKIAKMINEAINKGIELLVMPEMYIPYEWIEYIVDMSRKHQMAIIFGIENIIYDGKIGNYIAMTLPSRSEKCHYNCSIVLRLKRHYAPKEITEFKKQNLQNVKCEDSNHFLCIWNDIYIVPYYCYEIADIKDRAIFKNCCDIIAVSEFNKDTNYFNNIVESLSRDLFCYCIKANSSEFGGTCVVQPASSEIKYSVQLKGGENDYVVAHELDIKKLRNAQILSFDSDNKKTGFKPKPPGFDINIVRGRMGLFSRMNNNENM